MKPRVRLSLGNMVWYGNTCEISSQILHNDIERNLNVYFYMLRTFVFTMKV